MTPVDLLRDQFERIRDKGVHVVDDVADQELAWRPHEDVNSIAWLVWHVARVQDDHVASLSTVDQVWVRDQWAPRFGLATDAMDTGYGHTPDQVAAISPGSATVLADYLTAVTDQTLGLLDDVEEGDLDAVVDDSWDPPVTMGVRLNSVVGDNLQHLGQAALVRTLHEHA